jgi:hypothetical protein
MKLFILRLTTLVIVTITVGFAAPTTHAAETRGLRVVAKDIVTSQTGEVKLYNKSYAVIIGIDRYPNLPQDRQLSYAVKDAQGVEQVLKRQYAFDKIFTLYDQQATKERIQELLTEELPGQMGEDDALFIFWAGHGNQEKKSEGDLGYLVPYDGSIGKLRTVITMDEIKNTVSKAIPAKHVFYVFDACYSGLLTTRAVDNKSRRDLAYLKEITRERVRQVLTAGGKGQQVLDSGRNGHSVFTGRLIEILEAKGDFVTANEIQAIIREKVSGDARARGFNQTPAFDAISGSGDFVFIPNIEQKVQDSKTELARMEAELKRLEAQETEAIKHQSDQKQRQAEQKRKAAEARLKAEQLRQQHLAEEEKRQQEMLAERSRFETEQKQREQQMTVAQKLEEQRMTDLKAELAKKKKSAPAAATGSLEAAIAEIKRLNAEIEGIEATFGRELKEGKNRIATRYDTESAAVHLASKQKQAPLVRDEFETDTEFKAKVVKHQSYFSDRIAELEQKQQREITDLEKRLELAQQSQTADLRQSLKQLGDKEFTIGAESLTLELGQYNADTQSLPISVNNSMQTVKIAMNGTMSLPKDAARKFKQEYSSGLVRPEIVVKAGSGYVMRVALANDADSVIYEYVDGEFMTVAERKRRDVATAAAAERERLIYTDPQTGLMWVRNGNLAGQKMNWSDAMKWAKNLNYGGYNDWRLPTKEEFKSFSKRGGNKPSQWFNANGFDNIQSVSYWSGSSYADSTDNAWYVYMDDGFLNYLDKGYSYSVWPVRSEQF